MIKILITFLLFLPNLLLANTPSKNTAIFDTDEIIYDKNTGKFTSRGTVNIKYNDKDIVTDKIEYDTKTSEIKTIGKVDFKGGSDNTKLESNDFVINTKNDTVNFGMMDMQFGYSSFIRANSASMQNNKKISFNDVEYTACKEGLKKCSGTPTWKISASKISHNKENSSLTFKNMFFYMWNVPILYLPYFRNHVDKSGNKTGFLIPKFGNSSYLGSVIKTPFLLKLSNYNDLTLTPMFTSLHGNLINAEYRHNYKYGTNVTNISYKNKYEKEKNRWYFKTNNYIEINDTWRLNANIERASDDTYLRLYRSNYDPWLLSRITLEGSFEKSYLTANLYSYQDLRNLSNGYVPRIFPIINYRTLTEPNKYGGYFDINLNTANTMLDYVSDNTKDEYSFRSSGIIRFLQPYKTTGGHLFNLGLDLRGDMFMLKNVNTGIGNNYYTGTKGRLNTGVDLSWKYPLYRQLNNKTEIFEPQIQFIHSPKYNKSENIPNIDSKYLELTMENMFNHNRFAGFDLYESGTRLNYGLNLVQNYKNNRVLGFFIGQNYNINTPDNLYFENSGLSNKSGFSNIIASTYYSPNKYLTFKYKARIDNKHMEIKRHDLYTYTGTDRLNLTLNYSYLKDMIVEHELPVNKNEAGVYISSKITKHWRIFAGERYDLYIKNNIQVLTGLAYENDCFTFDLNFVNNSTKDRDYKGDKAFYFTLKFKTLGSVSSSFNVNNLDEDAE